MASCWREFSTSRRPRRSMMPARSPNWQTPASLIWDRRRPPDDPQRRSLLVIPQPLFLSGTAAPGRNATGLRSEHQCAACLSARRTLRAVFSQVNPMWIPYLMRDTFRLSQMLSLPYRWPRPDPVVVDPSTRAATPNQPYICLLYTS